MGSKSRHTAAPMKAPITMPGTEDPARSARADGEPVARIRAKGTMSTIHSGIDSSPLGLEALSGSSRSRCRAPPGWRWRWHRP